MGEGWEAGGEGGGVRWEGEGVDADVVGVVGVQEWGVIYNLPLVDHPSLLPPSPGTLRRDLYFGRVARAC